MPVLITAEEAKKLVSGSEERKCQLFDEINAEIKKQAQSGFKWAHFPSSVSDFEREWLRDELTLAGFKVQSDNPSINW
jgi:hypothetical protein